MVVTFSDPLWKDFQYEPSYYSGPEFRMCMFVDHSNRHVRLVHGYGPFAYLSCTSSASCTASTVSGSLPSITFSLLRCHGNWAVWHNAPILFSGFRSCNTNIYSIVIKLESIICAVNTSVNILSFDVLTVSDVRFKVFTQPSLVKFS